jgi:hypothetical protein
VRAAASANSGLEIALGGPSVKILGDWLARRLPSQVHVFPDARLDAFFQLIGCPMPKDPIEPAIDLEAVERSFPQGPAYRNGTIGVQ